MVAIAPTDALAESIARLLNHVDYPMIEDASTFPARASPGRIGRPHEDLSSPTVVQMPAKPHRGRLAAYLFVAILPLALIWALAVAISWPFAVAAAVLMVILGVLRSRLLR